MMMAKPTCNPPKAVQIAWDPVSRDLVQQMEQRIDLVVLQTITTNDLPALANPLLAAPTIMHIMINLVLKLINKRKCTSNSSSNISRASSQCHSNLDKETMDSTE